jgi:hypothetical protein
MIAFVRARAAHTVNNPERSAMLLINDKLLVATAVLGLVPSLVVASCILLNPPSRALYDQVTKEESHGFLEALSRGAPYLIILGVAICAVGLLASSRSPTNFARCELGGLSSLVNDLQQKGVNQFTIWDKNADFTVACTYSGAIRSNIDVSFTQNEQVEPAVRKHMLSLPGVNSLSRDEHEEMVVLGAEADLGENFESLMPLFVTVRGLAYSDRVYVMYDRIEAFPFVHDPRGG